MNIMTKRGSEDNIVTYEHYCDTKADLTNIPQDQISLGSVAIVLKDEDDSMGIYLANSNKEWISFSTGGGNGGTSEDTDKNDIPREMENEILAGTISVYTNPTASVVGTGIFTNRSSLTYVEMPKCETIGDAAFLGCSNLQTVSFPECTIIQQGAFSYCSNLASVEFNKCTEIKSGAFRYCYSLQTASFPKCTQIDSGAFQECSMLSNINAPLCTTISEYVFLSCNKLSSAIFPECISIGFSAFQNCYSLSTISFPKCITIGNLGFFSCNIREAIFPECKSVGDTVFVFCTELSKISFPKCEHIGSNAFAECTKLLSAYFLTNNVPTLGQSAFSNTPIMGKTTETGGVPGSVYVKASLLSQFKSAQYWSSFSSRIIGLTDEEIAALDANN